MATVNKDFKIKNGLVVEGTNATVNGNQILTENAGDQYILDLVGGVAYITSVDANDFSVTGGELAVAAGSDLARTGDIPTTTDEISEGVNNEYYTDAKVRDVLTTSTQTNITITEVGNELHITAENGVADSTTDDLTEGTINRYFTDQRALDATASAYDAAGAATTAENNAKSYADGLAVNYDPAGSATTAYNDAVAAAALDATSKANTAESNANDYTDGEITTALTTAQGYADTAEANANAYTDNAVSGLNWKQAVNLLWDDVNATTEGDGATLLAIDGHAFLTNENNGYRILITAGTNAGIWDYSASNAGYTWTLTRSADADAYGELIGAAVYVMEGTQYGSTSWVQSNHYLTNFTGQSWTQFSGQGSVTAGTGITVDGLEVSVNRTTVDTWYDAAGSADTVQGNLEDHAADTATHGVTEIVGASEVQTLTNKTINGQFNTIQNIGNSSLVNNSITVNGYSTALGDSVTLNTDDVAEIANATNKYYTDARVENVITNSLGVGGDIKSAIDSATPDSTDDLPEGTVNHYYTDARAKAEAAALLTNATQNNITITADANNNLTITAENGVADSTTDDLDEGSTNLYFTDSRALSAVSGADITPNTVTIDTYRKEEATQQYVASASTVNVHSLATGFESAKYLVRVVGMDGGVKHSQITEILLTVDGNNNVAMTEYGNVHTSTNPLASFSATNVLGVTTLTATTAVAGCEIIAAATMLSWAD